MVHSPGGDDWRKKGWDVDDPTKNYFTPEAFGEAVAHALKAPRGREAEVRQLLAIYDQAIAALHALLADIRAGNEPDVAELQQRFAPLAERAHSTARDLGATACSGSGSSFGQ